MSMLFDRNLSKYQENHGNTWHIIDVINYIASSTPVTRFHTRHKDSQVLPMNGLNQTGIVDDRSPGGETISTSRKYQIITAISELV